MTYTTYKIIRLIRPQRLISPMKNILLSLFLSAFALGASADEALVGFLYGQASAPDGTEWQSPEKQTMVRRHWLTIC